MRIRGRAKGGVAQSTYSRHLVRYDCIWASVLLHFRHAAASKEWRRPMELHQLTGANHFVSTTVANRFRSRVADGIRLKVHWEEPERFVQLLIDII